MSQNLDRSKSRVVKMPKLHDETHPADVWFERGMIYFEDPTNPDDVVTCTVAEFEERLDNGIWVYLNDERMSGEFVCGKQAAMRFYSDAKELIREAKSQQHVGLPLDVISAMELSRTPVSRRQGFETPSGTKGGFSQRSSGLIVPN